MAGQKATTLGLWPRSATRAPAGETEVTLPTTSSPRANLSMGMGSPPPRCRKRVEEAALLLEEENDEDGDGDGDGDDGGFFSAEP